MKGGEAQQTGTPYYATFGGAPSAGGGAPDAISMIMGMNALQNAFNGIAEMDARKRNQTYRPPQNNLTQMMIPLLHMQAYQDKQAKELAQARGFYGVYEPGSEWKNPDTGKIEGKGLLSYLPQEARPVIGSLGPEKGSAAAATMLAQQFKPETFGAPVAAMGPGNKPTFLQIGDKGTPREVAGGFSPMEKNPITRELKVNDKIITQEFRGGKWEKIAEAPRETKQQSGPFTGTGLDAQSYNIVLTGDPNSQEYRAAYAQLAQPKVTIDPMTMAQTIVRPDMSWARPPGQMQQPPAGLPMPERNGGEASTVGQNGTVPLPGGVPMPSPSTPPAQGTPQPSQTISLGGGATATVTPGVKPMTDGQTLAAGFSDRMNNAESIIGDLTKAGESGVVGAPEYVGSKINSDLGNMLATPERQQYRQAQEDWVRAKLRKESGAVIGDEEMAREISTYFPQPGDSSAVIKQKSEARRVAMDAMTQAAGPAYRPRTVSRSGAPALSDIQAEIERRKRAGVWTGQ